MQNGVVARAACIYTHNCSMQHMERIGGSVHPRAGVTPCAHIYVYMAIYYVDVNCILSVISQPASMTETGPQKNAELVRSSHLHKDHDEEGKQDQEATSITCSTYGAGLELWEVGEVWDLWELWEVGTVWEDSAEITVRNRRGTILTRPVWHQDRKDTHQHNALSGSPN